MSRPLRASLPRRCRNLTHALLLTLACLCLASATSVAQDITQCTSTCDQARSQCYSASGCSMSVDWPLAIGSKCAVCNHQYKTCVGFCVTTDAFRVRYLRFSNHPTCEPSCTHAPHGIAVCGMSDGCYGTCAGDELCALHVRRPDLIAAIYSTL